MKKCEDCKFAEAVKSSRTAEEWEQRAEVLGKRADKLEQEHSKAKKGFWRFLAPPTLYPSSAIIRLRSEQFNAISMSNSIRNKMTCTRYPEHIEVDKIHHCGEFEERSYT